MKSGFNKKGFVENFIIPVVVVLAVAITIILGGTIQNEWNASIQNDSNMPEITKTTAQDFTDAYSGMSDGFTPIVLIVYIIISILSAVAIRLSPIFTFVTVFLIIGLLILPMLVSNVYIDFTTSDEITIEQEFPATHFILTNFPLIYIGYILLIGLAYIFSDRF